MRTNDARLFSYTRFKMNVLLDCFRGRYSWGRWYLLLRLAIMGGVWVGICVGWLCCLILLVYSSLVIRDRALLLRSFRRNEWVKSHLIIFYSLS